MTALPFGKSKSQSSADAAMVQQFLAAREQSGELTARAALRAAHDELTRAHAVAAEARTKAIAERSAATIAIAKAKLTVAIAEHALYVAKEATERYMKAAR